MLRAVREILATDIALPLRSGITRGHLFTGDLVACAPLCEQREIGRRGLEQSHAL